MSGKILEFRRIDSIEEADSILKEVTIRNERIKIKQKEDRTVRNKQVSRNFRLGKKGGE